MSHVFCSNKVYLGLSFGGGPITHRLKRRTQQRMWERVTSDDPLIILLQRKSHGVPLCPLTESPGPVPVGGHRL